MRNGFKNTISYPSQIKTFSACSSWNCIVNEIIIKRALVRNNNRKQFFATNMFKRMTQTSHFVEVAPMQLA